MKKLLVVEDEKMIRRGIVTMVKRVPIEIEEVIECRNGEEALEILKSNSVDVVMTDIRMPKMDGIELVKQIQFLPDKPQVIVVSGYDDFNYAVEVLRHGVREYLLKPIERDKLTAILLNIEKELEILREEKQVIMQIGNQQFKYLILNKEIGDDEIEVTYKQFKEQFPSGRYVVICDHSFVNKQTFNEPSVIDSIESCIKLHDVEGQSILIMEEHDLEEFVAMKRDNASMGISLVHEGLKELNKGYKEALWARTEAFVKNAAFYYYTDKEQEYEHIPEDFCDQFVQLFGTPRMEEGLSKLGGIRFKAQMNKVSAVTFMNLIDDILSKLSITYERIIETDVQQFSKLKDPMQYHNIKEYYGVFEDWIRGMHQTIRSGVDDFRNKEKIMVAMKYIQDHYSKDLNMAVVSNHISMNYSLFSLNFKEYAGMNFVNYLKKIRITAAKKLLEETEEKIIDVSMMVGYDNEKHFMKTFKSVCGVSPSEYRKNFQMGRKDKV